MAPVLRLPEAPGAAELLLAPVSLEVCRLLDMVWGGGQERHKIGG